MIIKEIVDYSKDSLEADVIVTDGVFDCLAFYHPFHGKVGDIINTLLPLDAKNIMKSLTDEYMLKKTGTGYYSYYCVARVLDRDERLVLIGKLVIDLSISFPGWAMNGDYIEFECARFDI